MSSDEVRLCENEETKAFYNTDSTTTSRIVNTAHTLHPVHHIDSNDDDDDQISIINNIHKHRNIHIKRDSRSNYNFYHHYHNTTDKSTCHHQEENRQQHHISSKIFFRNYYQIVNVCLIVMLYVSCNFFITSVNCDELMESVGARGHYTHTWAVHIPGGERVAKMVADDHGMILRGKVSEHIFFILFITCEVIVDNYAITISKSSLRKCLEAILSFSI